jgi:hypothetical protein
MVDRQGGSGMSKRPSKTQVSSAHESAHEMSAEPKRKDEQWDDRLRRVGDANYAAVDWSTRDKPNWPLPTD